MQWPTDHQCIISITIGSNQHQERENWKMQWWRKRDTNTKGKIGKQERNTNTPTNTNMKGRMGKYRCYESFTPPQSRPVIKSNFLLYYVLIFLTFLFWFPLLFCFDFLDYSIGISLTSKLVFTLICMFVLHWVHWPFALFCFHLLFYSVALLFIVVLFKSGNF